MKKKIPTYPEISEELESQNPETQFLNSPIRENSDIVEPELLYTIDDLIDVWVRGCTNGATMWQFCQENKKELPLTFEYGLQLIQEEIRKVELPTVALHELITNNFMLMGLFQELIEKDNK